MPKQNTTAEEFLIDSGAYDGAKYIEDETDLKEWTSDLAATCSLMESYASKRVAEALEEVKSMLYEQITKASEDGNTLTAYGALDLIEAKHPSSLTKHLEK